MSCKIGDIACNVGTEWISMICVDGGDDDDGRYAFAAVFLQ